MDVKALFIEVTKQLTPFKMENLMEPYLPGDIQKDEMGNYFITIGKTKSMFTCHLDNYTRRLTNVNQDIFVDEKGKNKMRSDGKTPIGADDKAGMVIMLNMIEHKVPGCYYFFLGEEFLLSGGAYGSRGIYRRNPDFFKQFDRCIAFDRRGYGSIISRQSGGVCCSQKFVNALTEEFAKNAMAFKNDPGGVFTDSAVFMNTISEVSNLSVGYFNEHTPREFQNLDYLERLANATVNIDWENLPVARKTWEPKPIRKAVRRAKSSVTSKPVPSKPVNDEEKIHFKNTVSDQLEDVEINDKFIAYLQKVAGSKLRRILGFNSFSLSGVALYKNLRTYFQNRSYEIFKFNHYGDEAIYCLFVDGRGSITDAIEFDEIYLPKRIVVHIDGTKITINGVVIGGIKDFDRIFRDFERGTQHFLH